MESDRPAGQMSIGQLGHHIGLHVSVNLEGRTIGGVFFESEHWVQGLVVGLGGEGTYLTIELDSPIGEGQRKGILHRESHGAKLVQIDDPGRVRALELDEVHPEGVPDEIAELVRAGKTLEAIRRYRALNGATLDEARAYIAGLPTMLCISIAVLACCLAPPVSSRRSRRISSISKRNADGQLDLGLCH